MKLKDIKLKHIFILIAFAVGLVFLFIYIPQLWSCVVYLYAVIRPVIYGLVIAYILNYPYKLFYDHAFKKMGKKTKWLLKIKKPLAIILAYVIVVGLLAFLIVILIPELVSSINTLVKNVPSYAVTVKGYLDIFADFLQNTFNYNLYEFETFSSIVKMLTGSDIAGSISSVANQVLMPAINTAMGIGTGLYNWGIGFVISIYLISGKERLLSQGGRIIRVYTPDKYHKRIFNFFDICNNKCGKYIIGKIIDSLIIGIICFLGLTIFKFPYAVLISVIVGVFNVVPFFGPIVGGIICTFLLLIVKPIYALWFLIFIIVLQQFDGNILGPKILGDSVGISGFWILVSVLVGGKLFGVPGMVLAVPVFAVIYTLVEDGIALRERRKAAKLLKTSKETAQDSLQTEKETV